MSSLPAARIDTPAGQSRGDRLANVIIVAVICAIAVAAMVTAWSFPGPMTETDIGAARFPLIYCGALIVLSLILLAQNLAKPVVSVPVIAQRPNYRRVAIGMVLMVVDFVIIGYVGYFPAAIFLLMAMMYLLGQRSPIWNPVIALCITGVVYGLFDYALNVPLPTGSLFE